MDFTPTGTDFALLWVFLLLFAGSGWLIGSLLLRSTEHANSPACPFSCLEWVLCCLLGALAVTSVILLLTAQLGIFRIRFWLLFLAVFDLIGSLLWFARRRKLAPPQRFPHCRVERVDLWLLPLVAFAFWMMNRPSEFVASYRDPGEYVNIAVKLADSPSLRIRDPQFQDFTAPEKQALFLPQPIHEAPFPEVLPGFYLADPQKGDLLPQFFHLFPLWLALCFKLWRFEGIFLFNALLGTFSVLLIVGLAEQLFNSRLLGWAAGLLLAVNAGHVWISRSPFSEGLAQAFVLGGLTLLAWGMRTAHRGRIAAAGWVFGLGFFVRIDSVLIVAGLSVLLFRPMQHRIWLFIPLIGFASWCALHTWLFSFPYLFHAFRTVQGASPGPIMTVLLTAGVLLGFAVLRRLRLSSLSTAGGALSAETGSLPTRKKLATAITVLFGLAALYGLFVRPRLESARQVVPMPMPHTGTVPLHNELNLVRLSWYLTPLGLVLACAGFSLLIPRLVAGGSLVLWPFLAIFLTFAGFYLYKSQAFPDNYWVIRRYIEVVVPGCLILACFALQWLSQRSWPGFPPQMGLMVSIVTYVMLWGGEMRSFSGLLKERELSGTLQQLEVLAGLNRDADVVLVEQGVFQEFFSAPLKFIFQKTVYPLARTEVDGRALTTLVENWQRQGRRIHLLSSDEQTEVSGRRLRFLPKHRFEFKTRVVEPVYERLPEKMMDLKYGLQIYEVHSIAPAPAPSATTLNMDFNFGFPTRGFYSVETTADGEAFRWTSGPASLRLPELAGANDGLLSLSLAQDFPPGLASPTRIQFNGHLVAEQRLARKFEVVRWPIPKSWLNLDGRNTIFFDSATHAPSENGLSDDRRQLGLMVDGIKLETLAPISETHPFVLNVGSEEDILDADLSGFFGRDRDSYRWTEAVAEVKLLTPLETARSLRLVVRAVKSCPDGSLRQWMSVSLDGRSAGRTELLGTGTDFRDYRFTLQGTNSRQPVIQIAVEPTWNPASTSGSVDSRTLGCAIDWIRIE